MGDSAFFVVDSGDVYGCGHGKVLEALGLTESDKDMNASESEVLQIPFLSGKDIIDIQSGNSFSMVLFATSTKELLSIINYWSREHNIPDDVSNLLILFTKTNHVYSTTAKKGSGHKWSENKSGWNTIEIFGNQHINITQISLGTDYSLFLTEDGNVWSCGMGFFGQLGLGSVDPFAEPRQITYFKENNIRIRQIAAGWRHGSAVDTEDRVYSWGMNINGQCAQEEDGGDEDGIKVPTQIEFLNEYRVDYVSCGEEHSVVKTKCNKYFIFGGNGDNECMTFTSSPSIMIPYRIDNIIKDKLKINSIEEICLGYYSTIVVGK